MNHTVLTRGLVTLGLLLLCTATAYADRLPSVRSNGQKSSGSRIDMTVPYLNHSGNAFQGYSVAPQINHRQHSDKVDPSLNLFTIFRFMVVNKRSEVATEPSSAQRASA